MITLIRRGQGGAKHKNLFHIVFILGVLLNLTGCPDVGGLKPPPSSQSAQPANTQLARQLERQGDYAGAAREYQSLAQNAPSPQREELRLRAANALIYDGQLNAAKQLLAQTTVSASQPELRAQRQLLGARIAMLEKRPADALEQMPDADAVPADLRPLYFEVLARAHEENGRPVAGAQALVQLEPFLQDSKAIYDNQYKIWALLTQTPVDALDQLQSETDDNVLAGWLDLSTTVRATLQGGGMQESISQWRSRNPQHPAQQALLDEIVQLYAVSTTRPRNIALLLPMTGPVAQVAEAIRDGFLTGHFNIPDGEKPEIKVYDTQQGLRIYDLYRQAVQEGAEFVVGPLDKAAVAELAQSSPLDVPVLALNVSPGPVPANFYQFGLIPEDEAQQVADRAAQEGLRRAVAIVPETEWGARMLQAFSERMSQLGGAMVGSATFKPEDSDYTELLSKLLFLDQSEARYKALRKVLRRSLKFEPRRRQDAEFVFIAAYPRHARLITTQLLYYRAGDLPVYATSHVFTGTADPSKDIDMNGVTFCDIPGVLEQGDQAAGLRKILAEMWPRYQTRYTRLFAMGMDAYNLVGNVQLLQRAPHERVSGYTGMLHMDSNQRIHRTLQWARFIDGNPRLLSDTLPADQAEAGPGLQLVP